MALTLLSWGHWLRSSAACDGSCCLADSPVTTALMYHDLVAAGAEDSSGFPGRDSATYKVSPDQFEGHLRAITLVCAGSLSGSPGPTITFDDGGVSALVAADTLERHGFRGSFFVTADYIGTRGFLDGRGMRELRKRGHNVGSHSCSHPLRMGHCVWSQLMEEWTRSRHLIADVLGEPVQTASIPGGDFAWSVVEAAAAAGFTELFTSEPTVGSRQAFGLTLRGRFVIRRWTTVATVAGLASGAWLPCARQALWWNARKAAKRIGGERYLQLRRLVLATEREVRWGDRP
jgi:peptidoglycan/xylan/chitin deacetylase (PgdA/CDA1 family)